MSRLGHLETKQISQHTSSPRHLFGHMSLPRKRREASERITLNTRASKTRHVGSSAAKVCHLLGANNDTEYIKALGESTFVYLMSVFGFSHQEYPPQIENGGVELLALRKSICGEITQPLGMTLESGRLSCGLNQITNNNNNNLLSFSAGYNGIKGEIDLDGNFIAQRNSPTKTAIA
ncbi:hypothetical protein LB503_007114 [Fusarium chuoi]|nr:hypothetical protein LB503_007114 [Fusarium chuoi]